MNTIDCGHKNNCNSYPYKCDSCRKKPNKKDDFYEPEVWHKYPYQIPPIKYGDELPYPTPVRNPHYYWCLNG